MEQRSQAESALGGAAYGMLFVLGVVMGVVGGFTHGAWPGLPIVSAVLWLLLVFGVSLGAGKLMGGRAGAAVTSAGWLLVTMAFSMQLGAGDLVIAGTVAGHVYLYGGVVAAVAAFLMSPSTGGSWLLRGYPESGRVDSAK
ncbi:DUF6113 family protein [Nonomuraea sp. NPDC048826]|uniref:DUF6113 family protein n=1 Tax=Nonomuraea sp. NPDC048826 TaxID=3364347 RepID=UPI003710063E